MEEIILTVSDKISKETASRLAEEFANHFGVSSTKVEYKSGLIGGFTVKADGLCYDMSVKTHLERLASVLEGGKADHECDK